MYFQCPETGSFRVNPIESQQLTSLLQLLQPQTITKPKHSDFMGKRPPIPPVCGMLVNHLQMFFQRFYSKISMPVPSGKVCDVLKCHHRHSDFPDSHSHGKQQFIACFVWMNQTHRHKMGIWTCLIPVRVYVTRNHSPCAPSIVAFLNKI